MICRKWTPADQEMVMDLLDDVYGKRPAEHLFPEDCLVVDEGGAVSGFAALYRLDDVVIGAVDWAAIDESRSLEDRTSILGCLIDGLRGLKETYGLRAIMIHTPYDEIRTHLDAPDLQPGEQKIRRLVVSHEPDLIA
jgi:hypothetical protein